MSRISKSKRKEVKTRMKDEALKIVRSSPRSTSTDILLSLVKKDPIFAAIAFSEKPRLAMYVKDIEAIIAAKTTKERRKHLKIFSISDIKLLRPSVMRELKKVLEKEGEHILGSPMFGQVHVDDMTRQDAAMWLASNLSAIKNQSDDWSLCVKMIGRSKIDPEGFKHLFKVTEHVRSRADMEKAHEFVELFFRRQS